MVVNHPEERKPAHLFFDVDAVCHRRDLGAKGQDRRTGPSRSGKGGISENAEDDRGKPEATRIGCMGESVQASPNFRKAHPSRASLPHSPDFQIHSPWLRGWTSVQWRRSLICFSVGPNQVFFCDCLAIRGSRCIFFHSTMIILRICL